MTRYADENAKIDGAVFPMKERKHNKMPELTGVLEFSKTMLKSMVEEAKAGNTPVRVRLAVWPEQNGKNPPHNPYPEGDDVTCLPGCDAVARRGGRETRYLQERSREHHHPGSS